jgi:MFS family permease
MSLRMERNLALIPWHQLLKATNPWVPVFVLFTRGQFGLDGALTLASIYYLAVVVFEVPSGWMSDRLGRVPTLRFAALSWIVAFSCFLLAGDTFGVIAAGQTFLALGYASLSGTDVTFHYDTLEALHRQREYPDRQGWVTSRGLVAAATGALAGGVLGLVDLRLAFGVSLVLAVAQFVLTLRFTEPPRLSDTQVVGIGSQVRDCLAELQHRPLAWIFGYGIAMVVLEHVAFTLLQPWLTEALGQSVTDVGSTPLLAGAVIASTALVGSAFARTTAPLARRFGVRPFLLALAVLSATIVTAMALSTSLALLGLIAFRSAQGSAAPIVISTAVSGHVATELRATLLSLNSLAGRLTYGGLLLVLADDASDDVAMVLGQLAGVSWFLVVILTGTAAITGKHHGSDRSL